MIENIISKFFKFLYKNEITSMDGINYIYFFLTTIFDSNYNIIENDNESINNYLQEFYQAHPSIYTMILFNKTSINIFNQFIIIWKQNNSLLKNDISDIVNNVFHHYLLNDKLLNIKHYVKYYNNSILSDWVVKSLQINLTKKINIFDGNIVVNSFVNSLLQTNNNSNINIYGSTNNMIIKKLITYQLRLNNNMFDDANILTNDILTNDIIVEGNTMSFDVIFYNLVSDKHNIIHASCCNKVKKFKIRGTNYEALKMQLIMSSLNIDGIAIIIVPDSFLFSDSNQIVETRKYLVENFNIMNISMLDDNIYYLKGVKTSRIVFKNNGKTQNINFNTAKIDDSNKMCESDSNIVNYEEIVNNNYNLYKKIYDNMKCAIIDNNVKTYIAMKELVNFDTMIENMVSTNVMNIPQYYSSHIMIYNTDKLNKLEIGLYMSEKINETFIPNFVLFYFNYIINSKIHLFIKGKLNQIDINAIKSFKIPLLSKEVQTIISLYFVNSHKIYNYNIEQLDIYNNLKSSLFKTLDITKVELLSNICNIYNNTEIVSNTKMIRIIKNSLAAGNISFIENNNNIELMSNSYYITINKDVTNYIIDFIYYFLWFNMNKLIELSKLTLNTSLAKATILAFEIPIISLDIQQTITDYCKSFDNMIDILKLENNNIRTKDIISIMSLVHNFSLVSQ